MSYSTMIWAFRIIQFVLVLAIYIIAAPDNVGKFIALAIALVTLIVNNRLWGIAEAQEGEEESTDD